MYRPLAACMMPVMIGALVAMLQGLPVLYFLYAGFPLAVLAAALWTIVQMRREPVELHIRDGAVSVRSLTAAAQPRENLRWYRLLDVRRRQDGIEITLGYEMYIFRKKLWPDLDELTGRLEQLLGDVQPSFDV